MNNDTEPEWFVIASGESAGRPHLTGWTQSATRGSQGDWLAWAICPRCHAMVLSDRTWAHEQWHSATDYPIPADILAGVAR